jgi:hypothetical protein
MTPFALPLLLVTVGRAQAPAELVLPEEQRCLDGDGLASLIGDESILEGLSRQQVSAAMSSFLDIFARCTIGLPPMVGEIELEIAVACTGRVQEVAVLSTGGLPDAVVVCVEQTVRYVPFDAHDTLDGYRVGYLLRFAAERGR